MNRSAVSSPPLGWKEKDIVALVATCLSCQTVAVEEFVEGILALASDHAGLNCSLANEKALRFRWAGGMADVPLAAAKAKLRMVCARLATLCTEAGQDVSPYGGEGELEAPGKRTVLKVKVVNTPDRQEFEIGVKAALLSVSTVPIDR
jgi:hypothetical protein